MPSDLEWGIPLQAHPDKKAWDFKIPFYTVKMLIVWRAVGGLTEQSHTVFGAELETFNNLFCLQARAGENERRELSRRKWED